MFISGSFPVELLRAFDHVYMLICGIEILDITITVLLSSLLLLLLLLLSTLIYNAVVDRAK